MISQATQTQNPPALTGGSDPPHALRSTIDYLTLRWSTSKHLHQIKSLLHDRVGTFTESSGTLEGARHDSGMSHESGIHLMWTPAPHGRYWSLQLTLKGTYCTATPLDQLLTLVQDITSLCEGTPSCTRIDLCLDLMGALTTQCETPQQMMEFILANPAWTAHPFKSCSATFSTVDGEIQPTVYLGSKKSLVFVRFYDKGKQQGTKDPWFRWESQFRKEKAQAVFDKITQCTLEQAPTICRALSSSVVDITQTFPRLARLLFAEKLDLVVEKSPPARLHSWIAHARDQYLKHVIVAAESTGQDPYDLARDLGLLDPNPAHSSPDRVSHPRVVEILDHVYHLT